MLLVTIRMLCASGHKALAESRCVLCSFGIQTLETLWFPVFFLGTSSPQPLQVDRKLICSSQRHVISGLEASVLHLLRFYLFIFRERGGEGERKGEKQLVWLPLKCPLLGIWPTTQAGALTRNWTGSPLVCRPALNPLSHTSRGKFLKAGFNGSVPIPCARQGCNGWQGHATCWIEPAFFSTL